MGKRKKARRNAPDESPIATAWGRYHQLTMPPDVPTVQFMETRTAFFAGAAVAYRLMVGVAQLSDEERKATLQAMGREVMTFSKEVDRRVFGSGGIG